MEIDAAWANRESCLVGISSITNSTVARIVAEIAKPYCADYCAWPGVVTNNANDPSVTASASRNMDAPSSAAMLATSQNGLSNRFC
jgi:hypothetical protein